MKQEQQTWRLLDALFSEIPGCQLPQQPASSIAGEQHLQLLDCNQAWSDQLAAHFVVQYIQMQNISGLGFALILLLNRRTDQGQCSWKDYPS